MKKIRMKEKRREIRVPDRAKIAGERMKRSYLRSAGAARNRADDGAVTPDEYAADQARCGAEEIRSGASRAAGKQLAQLRARGKSRKGKTYDRYSAVRSRKVFGLRRACAGSRKAAGEMRRAALSSPAAAAAAAVALAVVLTLAVLTAPAGYGGGGGSAQIVQVALSQVGNEGGEPYWSWYGFRERVDWCACFVSWCADRCGYIESGAAPKFALCSDGMNWFRERGLWLPGGIRPESGMIVFFDWEEGEAQVRDGVPDHVGIVVRTEDGFVRTVEGNSADVCAERRYEAGDPRILGYGQIGTGRPAPAETEKHVDLAVRRNV